MFMEKREVFLSQRWRPKAIARAAGKSRPRARLPLMLSWRRMVWESGVGLRLE